MPKHAADEPDTLLTAEQAAAVLGIKASTLTAYAARGQAPRGRKIGSKRRWTLREIEHHRDHPPSSNPARRGRPPGATDTCPRKSSLAARRAEEIAARLDAGEVLTTAQLVVAYNVTERSAQRLLQRARGTA